MSISVTSFEDSLEQQMVERLKGALRPLMRLDAVRVTRGGEMPVVEFIGQVYDPADEAAFDQVAAHFEPLGYLPFLREQDGAHVLQAFPHVIDRNTGNPRVNVLFFLLTALSVLFIGALNEGGNPFEDWRTLALGLPHAATLLSILTVHEFSHYLVARRHGAPASLPYFVPLPVPPLGTMGAVIVQKSPIRNRKAVFDLGVSGPLGGLVLAVPLLIVGLLLSEVLPLPEGGYLMEGNSIFYYLIKWAVFGQPLPSGGMDVMLHPIAFAAWAGLLVTCLNLLPVGQLDGGHITYALWGRKAWRVARWMLLLMFAWAALLFLMGNGNAVTWLLFGGLGTLMGARHPAPLNDLAPLGRTRKWIGWGMVLLFVLILVPLPLTAVP